jgi:Rrf2 family transcriptional regulator, cysteine metabolism repressor
LIGTHRARVFRAQVFGLMKISAKSEYACLAVLALARYGRESAPVRIRDISKTYSIPERYLVQILLQLKGAGLVASTRGASGGYRLAREPETISLSEVLTAIDAAEPAAQEPPAASRLTAAVLASVWEDVRAAERAVLERTTVAQLALRCSPREWVI